MIDNLIKFMSTSGKIPQSDVVITANIKVAQIVETNAAIPENFKQRLVDR